MTGGDVTGADTVRQLFLLISSYPTRGWRSYSSATHDQPTLLEVYFRVGIAKINGIIFLKVVIISALFERERVRGGVGRRGDTQTHVQWKQQDKTMQCLESGERWCTPGPRQCSSQPPALRHPGARTLASRVGLGRLEKVGRGAVRGAYTLPGARIFLISTNNTWRDNARKQDRYVDTNFLGVKILSFVFLRHEGSQSW